MQKEIYTCGCVPPEHTCEEATQLRARLRAWYEPGCTETVSQGREHKRAWHAHFDANRVVIQEENQQ